MAQKAESDVSIAQDAVPDLNRTPLITERYGNTDSPVFFGLKESSLDVSDTLSLHHWGSGEDSQLGDQLVRKRSESFGEDSDQLRSIPTATKGILACFFSERPRHVLIVKRPYTHEISGVFKELASFLVEKRGFNVIVEPSVAEEICSLGVTKLKTWHSSSRAQDFASLIDFVITLGGDGTVLWVSNLFPKNVPPVLGVYMGSLGYLSQFSVSDVDWITRTILQERFHVCLRRRLHVKVLDEEGQVLKEFSALNECVIDRGPSSFLTSLDVYYGDQFFTHVTADGIILATPTGSTAYSMSAGGSVVHPKVPCILFTPTCPHTLSFRPVILPDTAVIRVMVPGDVSFSAWLAVDGRSCQELTRLMSIVVSLSIYPMPMIMRGNDFDQDTWLTSLEGILNWNQRIRQQHNDFTHNHRFTNLPTKRQASSEMPINTVTEKSFELGEEMLIDADDVNPRNLEASETQEFKSVEETDERSALKISVSKEKSSGKFAQFSKGKVNFSLQGREEVEPISSVDVNSDGLEFATNTPKRSNCKRKDSFSFRFAPDKYAQPVDLFPGFLSSKQTQTLLDIGNLPKKKGEDGSIKTSKPNQNGV